MDFLMTMSSSDEDERPVKRSKKEDKALEKQASKQQKKKGKSKAAAPAAVANGADDDDGLDMDTGFGFDALGGGGQSRTRDWGMEETFVTSRPNALPRVSIDEIIARRARVIPGTVTVEEPDEDEEEAEDDGFEGIEGLMDGSDADSEEEAAGVEEEDEDSEDGIDEIEGLDEMDDLDEAEDSDAEAPEEETKPEDWLKDEDADKDAGEEKETENALTGFAALEEVSDAASSAEEEEDEEAALAAKFYGSATGAGQKKGAAVKVATSFTSLPGVTLSRPTLLALSAMSLTRPTPIQAQCVPLVLAGKDLVASSQTGSGKTLAFWIGILERLYAAAATGSGERRTRVVVLTPTRELAVQVASVGRGLTRFAPAAGVDVCLCVGGLSLKAQEAELRLRPAVVVSTPGRLIDHVRNSPGFHLDDVSVLVLDEADRMLSEGFEAELTEILAAAPRQRQTLLFSATITESVAQLSRMGMNKPVRVKVDEVGEVARGLTQEFVRVKGDKKGEAIERGRRSGERGREALLVSLCTEKEHQGQTIVFFRSKAQAHRMKVLFTLFGEGLERSAELHGDLTQEQRLGALKDFREGRVRWLLATDLASRGLDIKGIENVINYEMPKSVETYWHRIGRTARAGKSGRAITLVGESDRKMVKLALKRTDASKVVQRLIDRSSTAVLSSRLRSCESLIKDVLEEEKEEKELRAGAMELRKGENLVKHQEEIMGRPKRTWFASEGEKGAQKNKGTKEHNSLFNVREKKASSSAADEREKKRLPKFAGMSRKEKRRKRFAAEDAEDDDRGEVAASVRSAKKKQRPNKRLLDEYEQDVKNAEAGGFTGKKKAGGKKKKGGKTFEKDRE